MIVAEGWNELQKNVENIRFPMWQPKAPILVRLILRDARSRPFIFNPLLQQCVLYSFRFRQSFPVHFKPKEKKRALFRAEAAKKKGEVSLDMRAVYCQSYSEREREAPPPIHKNINSFAAAIRDKIYYQPAGCRGWRLWEKTRLLLVLSLAESNIAGLYWSMPG